MSPMSSVKCTPLVATQLGECVRRLKKQEMSQRDIAAGLAYCLAYSIPLPSSAITDSISTYVREYGHEVHKLCNDINEVCIIDLQQVQGLLQTYFSIRHDLALVPHRSLVAHKQSKVLLSSDVRNCIVYLQGCFYGNNV